MDYENGGGEYCKRGHVPAFGSWDWNDAVPFTQCFETATTQQPGFLHYAPYPPRDRDRDLYLAGDLYDNHSHLVAPAVILLPRRRAGKRTASKEHHSSSKAEAPSRPKPVDEDLYKVSPQLLSLSSKRRKGSGFGCISRCFMPTRVL